MAHDPATCTHEYELRLYHRNDKFLAICSKCDAMVREVVTVPPVNPPEVEAA
jgi:hypothetical protein